jgi:endonuclease YncB( thermonuclease family)
VKYVDQLRSAQNEAMEKKKGIWGSEGLNESPSQYRKEHPRKKEFL